MRSIMLMIALIGASACTPASDAAFCGPDYTAAIDKLAKALPNPETPDDVGRAGTAVVLGHDAGCGLSFAASASGPKCGPSLFILQQLSRYGEVVHERITRDGVDWIMWVNEETGTWTLTGTHGVVTCAFAWGKDYDGKVIKDFLLGASL